MSDMGGNPDDTRRTLKSGRGFSVRISEARSYRWCIGP
jgi:hypothetical protein